MPDRPEDARKNWEYLTVFPGADYQYNQIAVQQPKLIEATGTDGRFMGSIRPFPGMADLTIHGIPKPEAGHTITSISNVLFAKYVAIQKGISRYILAGLVFIADNQAGDGSALYFAYRDSEDGSSDVVMLEDFASWDDFTLDVLSEYDVTSMGRYIYFVCSGDTSSLKLSAYDDKEPPYNKAYFWDWKINDWDAFDRNGTGFEGRFMSIMPQRLLLTPINADTAIDIEVGNSASVLSGDTTIYLSADSPTLSDVVAGDVIQISGKQNDSSWTITLTISSADDSAKTVTTSSAPESSTKGVLIVNGSGAATDGTTTIDLTADSPDLSGVSVNDLLRIAHSGAGIGAKDYMIESVDDGTDTLVVRSAPAVTESGLTWAIKLGNSASWTIKRGDSTMDSEDTMDFRRISFLTGSNFFLPAGSYTGALELISRKHGLRSYIRMRTQHALGTNNSALYWVFADTAIPTLLGGAGDINQLRGYGHNSTCILHWGIPHVDGYKFWRSPGNGQTTQGVPWQDKYTPIGVLYLVEEYMEKAVPDTLGAGAAGVEVDQAPNHVTPLLFGRVPAFDDGNLLLPDSSSVISGAALQAQPPFDALNEMFGAAPRMKRIGTYAGLLVGITDVAEPTDLSDWDEPDQRTEEICWSHTSKLEPENFPPENRYPPDDSGEQFLGFEPAGDHMFAIASGSVYKVTRSGSLVSLNRLLSRLGATSRFAATGVGNTLFLVTRSGVKSLDGNTGAVKSISSMDRIIMDDSEWAQSLGDVFLEYDAHLGVLIFLNTTKKECFLLWESTGAVTRLINVPWIFLTGGPDVLTNGSQRAYFVTATGTTHCIDGAREMSTRSMCGTTVAETVNGTCTTGSSTQIIDTSATFPANCVGHYVYIQNGNMEGDKAEITVRDSNTVVTVTGLSEATTTSTRYSVAPVVVELVFPQLSGVQNPLSPFTRKIVTSMSCAFSDLGGETGSGDTNPYVRFGAWRNRQRLIEDEIALNIIPDKCISRINIADSRVYPSLRFLGGNLDFELQALLIKGMITGTEQQSAT
jgi:hypothetical protein